VQLSFSFLFCGGCLEVCDDIAMDGSGKY